MKHAIIILAILAAPALAWDDCPFGLVDDPAPGRCRLYDDTNLDGICDYSQKKPPPAEENPVPAAEGETSPAAATGGGTKGLPASSPSAAQPPPALAAAAPGKASAPAVPEPTEPPPKPVRPLPGRHVWLIFMTAFLLAAATEWLTYIRKGLFFRLQSIWNWLLMLFFLASSATGLYFIFVPAQGNSDLTLKLYFWHVETGLAFVAIGAYHAVRRLSCMVRGLKGCFAIR